MLDLIYTPSNFWADAVLRAGLFAVGLALTIHMLCACNFTQRAPHWIKSGVLVPAVGAGVAMVIGAASGQVAWAIQGAAVAAVLLLALSVAQWWYGLRMADVFDRAMGSIAGEKYVAQVSQAAPFQRRDEIRSTLKRLALACLALGLLFGLSLLTGAPQNFWRQLTDDAPAIGYHAALIDAGEEITTPGGQLQVRWNVERLRICETGLRTWMVDSAGTEHVLDLRVSAPSKLTKAEPGVVNTYRRPYTVPLNAATGPAYITASVWHACTPVRSALHVYKHIHYNRAHFLIQSPKDKP